MEKGIFGEKGLADVHIFDSAHYVRIGVRYLEHSGRLTSASGSLPLAFLGTLESRRISGCHVQIVHPGGVISW